MQVLGTALLLPHSLHRRYDPSSLVMISFFFQLNVVVVVEKYASIVQNDFPLTPAWVAIKRFVLVPLTRKMKMYAIPVDSPFLENMFFWSMSPSVSQEGRFSTSKLFLAKWTAVAHSDLRWIFMTIMWMTTTHLVLVLLLPIHLTITRNSKLGRQN